MPANNELTLYCNSLEKHVRDDELAYYFANQAAGSSSAAVRLFCKAHDIPVPSSIHVHAHKLFLGDEIKKRIAHYREQNRIEMETLRDDNLAVLRSIVSSEDASNKDKIAAVKELNNMCGYNMQNHQMLVGLVDVVVE